MKISSWNEYTQVVTCSGESSSFGKPERRAQAVSFAAENDVQEIPSLESYSRNELAACFYTKADFNSFKKSSLVTLKLNRTGQLNPSEYCMRGLECRTREGAHKRKSCRLDAAFVLFEEQERQRDREVNNPELLAEKYHEITGSQEYAAAIQGMCDELEARQYNSPSGIHLCAAILQSNSQNFVALAKQYTVDDAGRLHPRSRSQMNLSHMDQSSFFPLVGVAA